MNQPAGSCLHHAEELASIAAALSTSRPRGQKRQRQSELSTPSESVDDLANGNFEVLEDDPAHFDGPSAQPDDHPAHHHIERYPRAGEIKEFGPTFMDEFNADRFGEERANHPYFPFASRDEWEFASFLLQSNLSMGQINTLLSLNLVGSRIWCLNIKLIVNLVS